MLAPAVLASAPAAVMRADAGAPAVLAAALARKKCEHGSCKDSRAPVPRLLSRLPKFNCFIRTGV
jgi:hypothetical protein